MILKYAPSSLDSRLYDVCTSSDWKAFDRHARHAKFTLQRSMTSPGTMNVPRRRISSFSLFLASLEYAKFHQKISLQKFTSVKLVLRFLVKTTLLVSNISSLTAGLHRWRRNRSSTVDDDYQNIRCCWKYTVFGTWQYSSFRLCLM